jgi:hypothetical protein
MMLVNRRVVARIYLWPFGCDVIDSIFHAWQFPKWAVSSFDHDEQEGTPAALADRRDDGGGHRSVRARSRWGRLAQRGSQVS